MQGTLSPAAQPHQPHLSPFCLLHCVVNFYCRSLHLYYCIASAISSYYHHHLQLYLVRANYSSCSYKLILKPALPRLVPTHLETSCVGQRHQICDTPCASGARSPNDSVLAQPPACASSLLGEKDTRGPRCSLALWTRLELDSHRYATLPR